MNPAYLPLWVMGTALSWLLPNHYLPWGAFHAEAMMALLMILAGLMVGLRQPWYVPRLTGLLLLLALVTGLQGMGHLIFKAGTAWVTALYLVGAGACVALGMSWERSRPGQPLLALFSAILIAAWITVGLQLCQWLGLTELLDLWTMGPSSGRPFGNFGQPNLAATFLLWALIGVGWLHQQRYVGGWVALCAALFLLWGVALTYSRTAWVGLGLLLFASWFWRRLWRDRRTPWVVTGLVLAFAAMIPTIGWLNDAANFESLLGTGELVRMSTELRPAAWRMFLDAIATRPWLGYGANQVAWAQLVVAPSHPELGSTFGHAHNLLLDLMLWFGIPVGFGASLWLIAWFYKKFREVANPLQAWPFLMILIIANHAMLELPLHYSYFLLPTCLLAGVLCAHRNRCFQVEPAARPNKLVSIGARLVLLALTTMFAVLVRDYFRVESSYTDLRFELAKIQYQKRGTPPDVVLLNQWRDFIELARAEPEDLTTPELLEKTVGTVATLSSPRVIYTLAQALSLAGQNDEAMIWLVRLCKTQSELQCRAVKADWQKRAKTNLPMAAVDWIGVEQQLK